MGSSGLRHALGRAVTERRRSTGSASRSRRLRHKPSVRRAPSARTVRQDTCALRQTTLPAATARSWLSMENPCPRDRLLRAEQVLGTLHAYCDRGNECRDDENYHCQPLYTTALNICAPSCGPHEELLRRYAATRTAGSASSPSVTSQLQATRAARPRPAGRMPTACRPRVACA